MDKKIISLLIIALCVFSSCNTKTHKERREEMLEKEGKTMASDKGNKGANETIDNPNYKQGVEFLEENGKRKEVTTTASGLQYEVITMGKGAKPTANDKVKVHYQGTLIDGTEFDSSYKRGEPATFVANQVIKGWTEALKLMPVGSKWIIYVPQNLAYGSRDAGQIKPFSTLVFEVELLEIVK